jgi:hypothetical protein
VAFADAKVKEDRRKEWDRAIEEVKAGIPMEESDVPGRIHATTMSDNFWRRIPYSPMVVSNEDGRAQKACKPIPAVWNGTSWIAQSTTQDMPLETQLRILDAHFKQSLECSTQTSTKRQTPPHDYIDTEEEWIEDDDPSLQLGPREPLIRLHLGKMEEMVAKLVSRLLLGTRAFSSLRGPGATANSDFSWQMKEMTERIEALQKGTTRLPAYSWRDDQSVQEERRELHRSMTALHKTALQSFDSDLMLAKICYNLLISSSPPSIITYNILIDSLTQLGQHDLAQIVVDSFLYDSKYRPSPATVRIILNHYTSKNDPTGFHAIVNRMRSVDGDMRLKKRALCLLPIPAVQEWALANKLTHRAGCISQKTPRSTKIFESLIQGSLGMTSITSAVRYVRAALREGAQLKSEIIFEVMRACVNRVDYRAGKSLMAIILSHWEYGAVYPDIAYSAKVRYIIYQLLHICGIDPSLKLEKRLPIKASQGALQNLLRHVRLESIADSIDRFTARLCALDDALGVSHLQPTSQFTEDSVQSQAKRSCELLKSEPERIEQACKILQTASKIDRRRPAKKKRSLAQAQFFKLQVIESRLATVAERIYTYQKQILFILFRRLSRRGQLKYLRRLRKNRSTTIAVRLALLLLIGRGREYISRQALRVQFVENQDRINKMVFTHAVRFRKIRRAGRERERERGVLIRKFTGYLKGQASQIAKTGTIWARRGYTKKGFPRWAERREAKLASLMYGIPFKDKRKKDNVSPVSSRLGCHPKAKQKKDLTRRGSSKGRVRSKDKRKRGTKSPVISQPGLHHEGKRKKGPLISKPSLSTTDENRTDVPSLLPQLRLSHSLRHSLLLLPLPSGNKHSELGAAAG